MKRKHFILIGCVILLGVIGIWFFNYHGKEKTLSVVTVNPHYGPISISVTATGTVQPVDTVAVGTQVSGSIKKLFVDFNSVVKKGQMLAQLDQSLFIAQVDQVSANVQQAQSNLIFENENFKRQSQLYTAGAISKADYESAQNLYKAAVANVKSVNAQLATAKRNLSFTNIVSPINGTILSRNVSEGQTVAASFNTPTLFSIAKDLTKMQVQASVDEADVGNVKQGEKTEFNVDAFPNDVFEGTVQEIRLEPTVSSNVVTYTTIINAPNNSLKLKPGMTANVSIYTKSVNRALLIPSIATKFNPDSSLEKFYKIKRLPESTKGSSGLNEKTDTSPPNDTGNDTIVYKEQFVWLKVGDTLVQRRITTGIDDDLNIQVVAGLSADDNVITNVAKEQGNSKQKSQNSSPFLPHRSSPKATVPKKSQ